MYGMIIVAIMYYKKVCFKRGKNMKSYYYSGDPYWTSARFTSCCSRCGRSISKGEKIFYYPKTKDVFCSDGRCGESESKSFEAAAQDEWNYNL